MNDSVTGQERLAQLLNMVQNSPLPSPQVEYSTTVWPKQFKYQLALHGNTTDWYQVICSLRTYQCYSVSICGIKSCLIVALYKLS